MCFKLRSNPPTSVLSPTTLFSFLNIVFTDCVLSARKVNSSRKGITDFLNGTVTFIPSIFPVLTSEIILSISVSLTCFLSYNALILFSLNQ